MLVFLDYILTFRNETVKLESDGSLLYVFASSPTKRPILQYIAHGTFRWCDGIESRATSTSPGSCILWQIVGL